MSRTLNVALNVLSVALLLAGAALAASIFVPQLWLPSPTLESNSSRISQVSNTAAEQDRETRGTADAPKPTGTQSENARNGGAGGANVAPDGPSEAGGEGEEARGPENKTLKVSIPEMGRVENERVPHTAGDDEPALKNNAAIHLEGTGHPWQEEANVYLAGHRIGFPGTDSFLGFYDLNELEKGDEVHVTDAEGERYTYRVFRQEVVRPENMSVTEPIQDRNILTLQTCTLPNYTQRLIVQAEKVA